MVFLRCVVHTQRAYSVHPSWSGMLYDDSCAGEQLRNYRENQFSVLEGTLQVYLTNMWNFISVCAIVLQCSKMQWAGVGQALRYVFAALIMGYMGATVSVGVNVSRVTCRASLLLARDCDS